MPDIPNQTRLKIAGVTAVCGLATAVTMTDLSRMGHLLPDTGFHLAAFTGAGMAGFLLSGWLGRRAPSAFLAPVAATALGAMLGGMMLAPVTEAAAGAAMGIIGLVEGLSHTIVIKFWGAAMIGLHFAASSLRDGSNP